MARDYRAPEGWKPKEVYHDNCVINFGKYKGQIAGDIPADYLLFMADNGWITLSEKYRDYLELEESEREEARELRRSEDSYSRYEPRAEVNDDIPF